MIRSRVAAVEGWFTLDDVEPHLLGGRCDACGTVVFPKAGVACPNPACGGTELAEVPLSRRGKIWSLTRNCYQPPPPYVAADPFEPYAVAAVELAHEKLVVLGQLDLEGRDFEAVRVGDEVELVLGPLFDDGDAEHIVWKWRPV